MRTPRTRTWALLALLVTAGVAGWFVLRRTDDPDAPPPPSRDVSIAKDNFALLVGCTEYPELEKLESAAFYASDIRLLGPGNDALLMQSTLTRYLGVPEANIRVLTGWPADPAARPTRANILGNLDRLAREVPRGARVLFLFAGHGSQQPDESGGDEADGTDEILLPADAGKWDERVHGVSNAITDDEIRARLLALRAAGAEVWALFDCCHSGTMMRGTAFEGADERADVGPVRNRGLLPSTLGIPTSFGAARVGAAPVGGVSTRGFERVGGILHERDPAGTGIVAISAAHSSEPAPEMVLPSNRAARDRMPHGLCTFQVVRALQRYGGSLTIAEIFEHVRAAYASMPWEEATPLVEGDLSLRVTSGAAGGAALMLLRRDASRLLLDAGSLRGLTVGTVLEVYRIGGFGDAAARLGRLALTEVAPLYSVCGAIAGGPDPASVPDGAPCRIGELAPGGPPLRLALVDATDGPLSKGLARRSPTAARLDPTLRAEFPFVDPQDADWMLGPLPTGADGVVRFLLGPARPDTGMEPLDVAAGDLSATLARIRRAESLRGWASNDPRFGLPEGVTVAATFRRQGSPTEEPFVPGVALLPGDSISLRVTNLTGRDVDVTVNCLDASQTESHVWPEGETSRRLTREERSPVTVDVPPIADDGIGRESLVVVVAVRSAGAGLLDVGSLSGESIPSSAGDLSKRQGEHALLDTVTGGKARGVDDKPAESVALREFAWKTTWGRIATPTVLFTGMVDLNPPVVIGAGTSEGATPTGRRATWRKARVIRGDDATADVLLLSGDGEVEGEGATGILVDENRDARLDVADPAEAVRRAAAGALPVELMVILTASSSSASYPRSAGDGALGLVRVAAAAPDRDRAARRFDLGDHGWTTRETCGPWLSTSFVPFEKADADDRSERVVKALRRFCRPR